MNDKKTKGWGTMEGAQTEFWDARPVFTSEKITLKDRLKLIFFPKKFLLYKWMRKKIKDGKKIRILDAGCGTGAAVIEMKKLWGKQVEVVGIDVIQMQIDLAKERIK
ncbi:hypothetical protein C0581_01085 [Candidatus Parcubacteria bacterium]|nr:MAG: hypothetical protein C0581_01085 [Candidatus Parcubacteria bacterium]